jgi:hypothetical protein
MSLPHHASVIGDSRLLITAVFVGLCAGAVFGILLSIGDDSPVTIHADGKVSPSTVKVGGSIDVSFTADRRRDCPGTSTHIWGQLNVPIAVQVVLSYPVLETTPKIYKRVITVVLPKEVGAGQWRYAMSLNSHCGRIAISDQIVVADIIVEP